MFIFCGGGYGFEGWQSENGLQSQNSRMSLPQSQKSTAREHHYKPYNFYFFYFYWNNYIKHYSVVSVLLMVPKEGQNITVHSNTSPPQKSQWQKRISLFPPVPRAAALLPSRGWLELLTLQHICLPHLYAVRTPRHRWLYYILQQWIAAESESGNPTR